MAEFHLQPLYPQCRWPRDHCDRLATHRVYRRDGTPVSPKLCHLHAQRWKQRLDTRPQDARPDASP